MRVFNSPPGSNSSFSSYGLRVAALAAVVSAVAGGCSSDKTTATVDSGLNGSSTGGSGGTCASPGGTVSSAPDTHCTEADGGKIVQETSQASCHVDAGSGAGATDYGDTLNNAEGDDDDCKYHVSFTETPICENTNVTVTVTATNRTDGTPLTGASTQTEVFLTNTHLAPNTNPKTTETSPGVYSIGPIQFDRAGKWTLRFHFFETCSDALDDSPHGHAAFYINVP